MAARDLAVLVVEGLHLEDVDPGEVDLRAPLFGGGLDLDSLDMLEISLLIQQRYGVKLKADDPDNETIFASLQSLAEHIGKTLARSVDSRVEWMQSLHVGVLRRAVSFLMLGWLAVFLGRTLAPGQTPLIERIARISDPAMTAPLRRYTRRLTAVWCGYFVIAALISVWLGNAFPGIGCIGFAGQRNPLCGEHRLRPHLFPGQAFPGLV